MHFQCSVLQQTQQELHVLDGKSVLSSGCTSRHKILIVLYFHTPSLPLSFFFSLVITRQPTELFDPTALIWNISSDQISLFLSFSMSSLVLSSSRRERGEVHWPERLPFQPEAKQSLTRV